MKVLHYCLGVSLLVFWGLAASASQPKRCEPVETSVSSQWLIDHEAMFKQSGCWSKHLELGYQALDKSRQQKKVAEVMKLSLQMASSEFYLGNYDLCYRLCAEALVLANQLQDVQGKIEALYLQSAVMRAKHLPQAIPLAAQALAVLKHNSLEQSPLAGKVHFNLGAAYSDASQPNLLKAEEQLLKAYKIFIAQKQGNDALRAGLRRVRVAYLSDNLLQAQELLQPLKKLVDSPRGQMLYDYQVAKVLHKVQDWEKAQRLAETALNAAEQLDAAKDQQRINLLLRAIEQKQVLID